jgi:hypothetical protein
MGGVGTAAGNDSAMPYLNPAGLASLPGDVFGVSAQMYSMSRRKVDRFFSPDGYGDLGVTGESQEFRSSQVLSVPTSVMYMKHLSKPEDSLRHVLAVSLVVPTQQAFSLTGSAQVDVPSLNGSINQTKNIDYTNYDYYFGPSYALAIGDSVRLGVTAYTLYSLSARTSSDTFVKYVFNGARLEESVATRSETRKVFSIVPVLGAQFSLMESLKLGLGVAIPSIRVGGEQSVIEQVNLQGNGALKRNTAFEGEGYAQRPLRINAGVAYEKAKSFSVGADVHYYFSTKKYDGFDGITHQIATATDNVTRDFNVASKREHESRAVIDLSLGGEVWLFEMLALRGGFFTNRAPRELDKSREGLNDIRIDRVGGSLGVGLLTGSFETTFGVVYQHGSGQVNILDSTSSAAAAEGGRRVTAVDIKEDAVMFVMSGVVTSDQAKKTISDKTNGLGPSVPGLGGELS